MPVIDDNAMAIPDYLYAKAFSCADLTGALDQRSWSYFESLQRDPVLRPLAGAGKNYVTWLSADPGGALRLPAYMIDEELGVFTVPSGAMLPEDGAARMATRLLYLLHLDCVHEVSAFAKEREMQMRVISMATRQALMGDNAKAVLMPRPEQSLATYAKSAADVMRGYARQAGGDVVDSVEKSRLFLVLEASVEAQFLHSGTATHFLRPLQDIVAEHRKMRMPEVVETPPPSRVVPLRPRKRRSLFDRGNPQAS
jgi:hypothetical protein